MSLILFSLLLSCYMWTWCDSVFMCVCVWMRLSVCVRLFSGLSHRSLRCLADFYADGLINGWETLVLHRGSLLSIYQHTTWHTHTLTSTYTQQTCGHGKKAQANSIQPYQSEMEKQLIIQQRREDMNCKNTEFYFGSWPHWIQTELEMRRRTQWSFSPIVFSQTWVLFPDITKFPNIRIHHRLLSINNQIHVFPLTCRFGPSSVGAALNVRASFDQGFYDLMLSDRQTPVRNPGTSMLTG